MHNAVVHVLFSLHMYYADDISAINNWIAQSLFNEDVHNDIMNLNPHIQPLEYSSPCSPSPSSFTTNTVSLDLLNDSISATGM